MTHPEELLAPYVDGTASSQERAAVDSHVSSCARCRAEIRAATAARAELRKLPVVDAPPGLVPDVSQTVPVRAVGASGPPNWYRWAGVGAVAAVIVLLFTLVLPNIGGGSSDNKSGLAASGPEATAEPSPVPIEIQTGDYRGDALTSLISAEASDRQSPAEAAATVPDSPNVFAKTGTPKQAAAAQACIKTAFKDVPGTLVRLISAPFRGVNAFIGIYEEGPSTGQPVDSFVARVAAARTCTPLSLAQAHI